MKKRLRFLSAVCSFALAVSALPLAAHAASATWTGTNGTSWGEVLNWNPNNTFPNANTDIATFNGVASSFNQPNVGDTIYSVNGLVFETGGWTISGGTGRVTLANGGSQIKAGVNTISANLRFGASNQPVKISPGATLLATGQVDVFRRMYIEGGGTLVYNGSHLASAQYGLTLRTPTATPTGTTLLLNHTALSTNGGSATPGSNANYNVGDGTILGGTAGATFTASLATVQVGSGGTLAPGGNGTYGAEIESFNVSTNDANVQMLSGSILSIQLGATSGINDLLAITSTSATGGYLDLTAGNVTLDLWGDINQAVGDYTFATFDTVAGGSANYGTFGTVKYNGAPLSPALGTITYNTNSIMLTIIPEPASLALLGLGGAMIALRRQRA